MAFGTRIRRATGWAFTGVVIAGIFSPCRAQTPDSAATVGVRITGVRQITISVSDLDRALAFYTGKLGFELAGDAGIDETEDSAVLAIPGSPTRILLASDPRLVPESGDGMGTRLAGTIVFAAGDLAGTYSALAERGVEFEGPPVAGAAGMTAVFRDPDGNRLALAESRGEPARLAPGLWTGALTDLAGVSNEFRYVVTDDDGFVRIKLIAHGVEFRLMKVRYDGNVLGFNWRPGPSIDCTLYRQMNGSFAGTCVNQSNGDVKTMTMVPPGR